MDIPRARTSRSTRWLLPGLIAVALAALAWKLLALEPAAAGVPRRALLFANVERGDLPREVRGNGVLLPERVRWISAVTSGRVERVLLDPGAQVSADTLLLELSNPDVELQLLEVERQLAAARAELVDLRANLDSAILAQSSLLAQTRAEHDEALRQLGAQRSLGAEQLVSAMELSAAEDRAAELAERWTLEQSRVELLRAHRADRLAGQQEQLLALERIQEFRRRQLASLGVTALEAGVLQALDLNVGQWVQPGERLATVARGDRLKAELQIPEARVAEVREGQSVTLDLRSGAELSGTVSRVDPAASAGFVLVSVRLPRELPSGARPDLNVDGRIELELLHDVLHVERPVLAQGDGALAVYRLAADGNSLTRVDVQLGLSSARRVEVVAGLREGDVIVLNDMRRWQDAPRLTLE